MENDTSCQHQLKMSRVAILISDIVDFRENKIISDKEDYFIITEPTVIDTTIPNIYASNNRASKYMK